MFCYQCEQTAKGEGCKIKGVCGKEPEVAALQDLLTYAAQGLGMVAHAARQKGISDPAADRFTCEALFATLTNVDFDPEAFIPRIQRAVQLREDLKAKLPGESFSHDAANFTPASDLAGLVAQGEQCAPFSEEGWDPDAKSLRDTVIFGLRGVAAYADHAAILGQEDDRVYAFIHEALGATLNKGISVAEWVNLALRAGEANLWAMEKLDAGNTGTYGHPVPTPVPLGHKAGKAILVRRPRPEGSGRVIGAEPGQGHLCVHPTARCSPPTAIRS